MPESGEKEDSTSGPYPASVTDGLAEFEALVADDVPGPADPVKLVSEEQAPAGQATPVGAEPVKSQPAPENAAQIVAALRKSLADKEADLAEWVSAYSRLKEESDGFRKRMEQLQRRRLEQSKGDFIARFVEVLDNLDRAIDSIENNFDSDSVLQGIILVRSRLVALLREEGLEKIFVGGQPFDPMHSEAAGIEPVEDALQDNVVIREVQRGYMLKESLLRPSRVIVGRYQGSGQAPEQEATPATGEANPRGRATESEPRARSSRNR